MSLYMKMSQNINKTARHLKFRYIFIIYSLKFHIYRYIYIYIYIYTHVITSCDFRYTHLTHDHLKH